MDKNQIERLHKKYGGTSSKANGKKEMNITGRGNRDVALGAKGKPKNLKATIIRLLKYLSKEKVLLITAFFCALLYSLASLTASYMLRPIMNKFLYFDANETDLSARIKGLAIGLVFMTIVYLIAVLSDWLQQRIMLVVSQRALKKMRKDLMSKLQTMPISYFDKQAAGDIMSRFTNDVDALGEMLNTTLIKIISGIITIIGTIILMLYTNYILGLITIILTPILVFASKTIIKKGRGAFVKQQQSLAMIGAFSEEIISGQKVVKVFNHEDIANEEFEYLNEQLCDSQIKAQFRSGIMGPVTHQLCNLTYAISACVGGILVVKTGFDIGGLAVSLNYTRRFNRPINEISMQMNVVMASLAGAERVFELLDAKSEKPDENTVKLDKLKGHIVLDSVYFGYNPEVCVLHNISLEAKPGEKIAFVGSTGAGKTTVTNLLSRFYDIAKGTITIDGIKIEKIDRSFLRSNIAMVLQDTHLFTGTIRENIRYGRLDATDEEVEEAAKVASAHSFISKLPNGYDTILENDGANLSQGQRQLLNIARASISKAPILILDEATSSVDTRTEKHIEKGMNALMKNRTTFVIAHRLSTVRSANCIKVLEKGHIIESGSHEELLSLKGKYYELYNGIVDLD